MGQPFDREHISLVESTSVSLYKIMHGYMTLPRGRSVDQGWAKTCSWLMHLTAIATPNPNPKLRHTEYSGAGEVHMVMIPKAK